MKKESKRIDPSRLGIPESSMDPMGTIRMEGNLYRGIASRDKHKRWWVRIMGILVGILFIGSAFFAFASAYQSGAWGILPGIVGFVLLVAALKMIWANIF